MLTVTIETDNEAMSDADYIAGALRHVAQQIEDGYLSGPVYDANGNAVGSFNLDYERAAA